MRKFHFMVFQETNCIVDSTITSEFIVLTSAGYDAKWLRNLMFEIPIKLMPISLVDIPSDSMTTLAKAYSQVYTSKYSFLALKHNLVLKFIINRGHNS